MKGKKMYLTKSKFCSAKRCNKKLWLDIHSPELAEEQNNEDILKNGIEVGNLARNYFGEFVNIEFNEGISQMVRDTINQLGNAPNIITEASFIYDNNFCSIDILKNDKDGVELYEVKSSTDINETYLDDIAFQYFILKNLGCRIKNANIMFLNKDYIKDGDIEIDKLFKISDVTKLVKEKQEEVEKKISEIKEYLKNEEEQNQDIERNCLFPSPCPYWDYCTKNLPENNVFKLSGGMRKDKKLALYKEGLISYEDLEKVVINKKARQQFLEKLSFPLYFLDFETFQTAIPRFNGTSPYQQIPFQYSLHYIEEPNGELKHKEFLAEAGVDPRRKLAEQLVDDIPENVCVTAYNMGFEKSVITKLAEQYEDLREHLLKIKDNIQDLIIPFRNRMYYAKEMEGSYSIKKVLPALFPDDPDLNYKNLDIVHNGREASSIFSTLDNKSKEEQEEIRKSLLKYCKLDTLAMVKLWEKLKESIAEKEKEQSIV